MEIVASSEMLVIHYATAWGHNTQSHNLKCVQPA